MHERLVFREELLNSLSSCRADIEISLVHLIHVLKSKNVDEKTKLAIRDILVDIGKEINGFYSSIKVDEISPYDIRDTEKRIIEKNRELQKRFHDWLELIDKKCDVTIDRTMRFSIGDIVTELSGLRISGDYALTRDKIENLLAEKRFLLKIDARQTKESLAAEKQLERDLFAVKEKSFLEIIRYAQSRNPEAYFKSLEILKKLIDGGTPVAIDDTAEKNLDEVRVRAEVDGGVRFRYECGGMAIACKVARRPAEKRTRFDIDGSLGKGASSIDYSIALTSADERTEQIERWIGLEYLFSHYEKAYMEHHEKEEARKERSERLDKNIVYKAVDDFLFG